MTTHTKKLITHNGSFHADDVFAAATLSILLEKNGESFEIIRTRDEEIIKNGDYVFDVGGVYDPATNRFDHHQKGGAGKRENGIEYAAFGLVWKNFGMELCLNDKDSWELIDKKIACPIDAIDNGIDVVAPKIEGITSYGGEQPFLIFSPTWQEDESKIDDIFLQEVKNASRVLKREIEVAKADSVGKSLIRDAYKKSADKKIIELPNEFPRYLYQTTLSELPEPIYVVFQSNHSQNWKIEAIRKSPETMESRKLFPESWRGIYQVEKLAEVTEVSDVIFCHRNGFLISVKSYESAIKLAQKALEN